MPFTIRGMEIKNSSELESISIEIGWAFLPRFFSLVESYYKSLGYKDFIDFREKYLPKKLNEEDIVGITTLSKLRTIILHGDGDERTVRELLRLGTPGNQEPHVLPEHIEKYYEVLKKLFSSGLSVTCH